MKRKFARKLNLSKQTMRSLVPEQLEQADGATWTGTWITWLCTTTIPKPKSIGCKTVISIAADGGCDCADTRHGCQIA